MNSELDVRIAQFSNRIVATWGIISLGMVTWFIFNYPLWWLIPLGVGLAVLFPVMVFVGGFLFGAALEREDELSTIDFAGSVEIVGLPDEKIGTYMGFPIYEWLDVSIDGEVSRYAYETIANRLSDGRIILPMEPGVLLVNGMIYRLQPENSEGEEPRVE